MTIKERIVDFMRESAYNPMLEEELMQALELDKSDRKLFSQILEEMEKEGLIIKTRKKRYGVPERMGLIVGRLQGNPKGFGFIISDNEEEQDVFIPANLMQGAMHNDRVIARINNVSSQTNKPEGEIIRILKRANKQVVGTYEDSRNFGFVIPDDKRISVDIYIPKGESRNVKDGYKVVCEITRWPEPRRNPEGVIVEVLGHKDDNATNIAAIMKKFGLKAEFPQEVEREAEQIPDEIPEEEIKRRRDLRDLRMVTIDGADAKDLDDAVSIEKIGPDRYRLGVHIADVSHYVRENSALDKEALERATSVYLVDRVIPMLPKKLSNGVCSLNPKVDRLALSVFMEIDQQGQVLQHEVVESVIRSKERMIYDDVSDILEKNDQALIEKYKDLVPDFRLMEELCKILRNRREHRGAIDFDFPEAKVILDEGGKPVEIKKVDRRIANRIIEEFMLVCNETIAETYYWLNLPFVYRVHEDPSLERIEEFNRFIHNFGYHLKGIKNEIKPKTLQSLLKKIEGKKEEVLINTLMLRSLKKARYAPSNYGHFGLAAEYYCHFTSPIRRYPDLAIHRIIKAFLQKGTEHPWLHKVAGLVPYISEQSSYQERNADEAERESVDLKKAEYMAERIGEVYEGVISGVISFGMFVQLENTVEGLVRVSSLEDDYYIFDNDNMALIGERKRRVFRIGDVVKVRVARVDTLQREIDFVLEE